MYNETQLAAIKLFGDKTLSEGCMVKIKGDNWIRSSDDAIISATHLETNALLVLYTVTGKATGAIKMHAWLYPEEEEYKTLEILGHEPHLFPDVARVAEEKGWLMQVGDTSGIHIGISIRDDKMQLKRVLYRKSLPLLSQPHLSEIVNLFSK